MGSVRKRRDADLSAFGFEFGRCVVLTGAGHRRGLRCRSWSDRVTRAGIAARSITLLLTGRDLVQSVRVAARSQGGRIQGWGRNLGSCCGSQGPNDLRAANSKLGAGNTRWALFKFEIGLSEGSTPCPTLESQTASRQGRCVSVVHCTVLSVRGHHRTQRNLKTSSPCRALRAVSCGAGLNPPTPSRFFG